MSSLKVDSTTTSDGKKRKKKKTTKTINENHIESKRTVSRDDEIDNMIKKIVDLHGNVDFKMQSSSPMQKKLVGYYSKGYAELFGSWIWKTEDGKEIIVTEVCEEGKQPITMGCLISYVGPVKQFVKRLCPTSPDKESNCICKSNTDVFVLNDKPTTLRDQGF